MSISTERNTGFATREPNRPGPVLFVCYGGGHIAKVAPVLRELTARGVDCRVMALTAGYRIAQQAGLSPLGYRDFLHLADDPDKVLQFGRSLVAGNAHPDVDEHESHCYLGINYAEWVDTHGAEAARQLYAQGGRRIFLPVRFMGKVLDQIRPACVVTTSSPRSERAATEAAVARGIPTLNIMDLFGLPYDIYPRQPVHADRITVMSEYVKNNLMAAGIDASRIAVTGCPAYDALHDPASLREAAVFLDRMGWQGKTVVMYPGYLEEPAPNCPKEFEGVGFGLEVERRLRQWVERSPDRALVVRYHPNQYHEFPSLGEQDRVYVSNPTREPVSFLVNASDVVVVQATTVGLEAALAGKRVLNLRFAPSVINLDFDYSVIGLAEPVGSMDEILSSLDNPGSRPPPAKVLPPPGPAAPRVADQILQLSATAVQG
jgi:hypothetical protein